MRKIKSVFYGIICAFGILFAQMSYAVACTADEIDIGGSCVDAKFTVETTNLSANTTFKFVLSATGTFYVDWGDNTQVDVISRVDTTPTEYSHTFTSGGVKYIRFGGVATGYNTTVYADKDASGAAIRFGAATNTTSTHTSGSPTLVAKLNGSIGSVFPTLGSANNEIPIFYEMCVGCSNLTSISDTLFSGVTGAKTSMFRSVFDKCSKLTSIPGNLFSGVSGSAESMFRSAFYECTSLTVLPANLFSGINGPAKSMFQYTFFKTSSLTGLYIPTTLFAGLNGQNATDLFLKTFENSGLMTSCPNGMIVYSGYNTYYPSWNSKVSCEPVVVAECEGASYKDDNVCIDCPYGYDYDQTDGKTSVEECTMHCSAGTWTGEYELLDYLESSGTQYIDTGHVVETSNLSADFEISSGVDVSGNIGHFGGNQDALNGHAVNFKENVFGLWVAFPKNGSSTGSKTKNGGPFNKDVKKLIHYGFNGNQRTLSVDGNSKTENFEGSIISQNTYRLFSNGCLGGCNDKMLEGRMHWFKLYEDGDLVYDFIPVRRTSDNVLGMYDRVHGQFFTNSGTGDFTAGPVIATIAGNSCENVGYGYYSADSETNYGNISQRVECGPDEITDTETSTSVNDCHAAINSVVCAAGTYLPANASACSPCTAGNWCPGGVLEIDTVDTGIYNCATEIDSGWTSDANASAQTNCYYLITLNKNGFSGVLEAHSGIGCTVASTAEGTTNGQLKLFYNTRCTMPALNLTQTGFAPSTGWSTSNTIGAATATSIPAVTTTPAVTTYYARKSMCAVNYYKTGTMTCGVCPAHTKNTTANTLEHCTCEDGYTDDGSSNGATTSTVACKAIGNMSCAAGKYVPAETDRCDTCPIGAYCSGGDFTVNASDQGIQYCATEIESGWTSVAGKSAKSDCYYPITLNKNGFSGEIPANAGTGCQVLETATGTNNATLQLFYNTACTLPTINLTQSNYTNATSWTDVNTLGGNVTTVTTLPATSTAPVVSTYYAYKSSCGANAYKSSTKACSACGQSSTTPAGNVLSTCNCDQGFTADGTAEGAITSTNGCAYVVGNTTYLHVGERLYKILSQRRTTPSICIGMDNTTYYVSLVPAEIDDAVAVEYDNQTYSGCDIVNDYCIVDGHLYWADPNLYLKSSGTQYINTGVVPDLNTAVEIEMADTSIATYALFGLKTGTLSTTDEGFGISLSGGNFGFFRNGTSTSTIAKDNNYHVFYLSNTEAKVDGTSYSFGSSSTAVGGNEPMYAFGFNHNGFAYDKTMSIKYIKIWSGSTLIRHFVPVPTGLVIGSYTVPGNGMFDIVNQTFYANPGAGDFQYGKEQ